MSVKIDFRTFSARTSGTYLLILSLKMIVLSKTFVFY